MTIKYVDLESAFDFVSFGSFSVNEAYFSIKTGQFYWVSPNIDEGEEPIPDNLYESNEYIQVPSKHDLDLGKRLVFDFVNQFMGNDLETVSQIFSKKGAYSCYKDLLERKGMLEQWYKYEEQESKKALLEWAKQNEITLLDVSVNNSKSP